MEDWKELFQLSVEMGLIELEQAEFGPVARYFDGVAQYGQGAHAGARRKFELIEADREAFLQLQPRHALKMVHEINSRGFAHVANTLAGWLEGPLSKEVGYWTERAVISYNLGDSASMVDAARSAWEISKESSLDWRATEMGQLTANNYAAALLLARTLPAKALTLTRRLYSRNPESIMTMLNHASALLQNYRPDESATILSKLRKRVDRMSEAQRLDLKLIEFQQAIATGSLDEARQVSEWLEARSLAPLQREVFESARLLVAATP